jgi:glycosyltransferase involved in cell wall biosynthesis
LIIEALNQPETAGVRCLIAGDGEERDALRIQIEQLGMTDRVKLLGRLSEAELLGYLSRCRAVCFPPLAEDYGFVTVEAFASKKAVITCYDSGGPAELVEHGVNGVVCSPTAAALAVGIEALMDNKNLAERYGSAGHDVARALSWEGVVARLVVS